MNEIEQITNWEEYLFEFEGSQKEILLDNPKQIEKMTDQQFKEGFSDLIGTNYSPHLEKLIKKMMDELTDKQRQVLLKIYWESKTEREVADSLGVAKSSVHDIKKRAQVKIGQMLLTLSKKMKTDQNHVAA